AVALNDQVLGDDLIVLGFEERRQVDLLKEVAVAGAVLKFRGRERRAGFEVRRRREQRSVGGEGDEIAVNVSVAVEGGVDLPAGQEHLSAVDEPVIGGGGGDGAEKSRVQGSSRAGAVAFAAETRVERAVGQQACHGQGGRIGHAVNGRLRESEDLVVRQLEEVDGGADIKGPETRGDVVDQNEAAEQSAWFERLEISPHVPGTHNTTRVGRGAGFVPVLQTYGVTRLGRLVDRLHHFNVRQAF